METQTSPAQVENTEIIYSTNKDEDHDFSDALFDLAQQFLGWDSKEAENLRIGIRYINHEPLIGIRVIGSLKVRGGQFYAWPRKQTLAETKAHLIEVLSNLDR